MGAQRVRGILLCVAWYYAIIAGFFILYCPVTYVFIFNHKLYRILVDQLFALWELYPVALFQWCSKMKLDYYGDLVNRNEKAIIIMNHRTRVDWNYIWIALYHATQNEDENNEFNDQRKTFLKPLSVFKKIKQCFNENLGGASKTKFVLKDEIKYFPALGWVMQLNCFLYVKRNWRDDRKNITEFLNYYNRMDTKFRLLLFPEGTDLSESNLLRSDQFANDNNIPRYKYVLHPRTTGWAILCSQLLESGLDAVYDVTAAYDNPAQTEMDLIFGRLPQHTYFCFKKYAAKDLPLDENSLRSWINQKWLEKEQNLKSFVHNGSFLKSPIKRVTRSLNTAKIGFVFWNTIGFTFMYLIVNNKWFQLWVIYHTLLFIFISLCLGGFQNILFKFYGFSENKN